MFHIRTGINAANRSNLTHRVARCLLRCALDTALTTNTGASTASSTKTRPRQCCPPS